MKVFALKPVDKFTNFKNVKNSGLDYFKNRLPKI